MTKEREEQIKICSKNYFSALKQTFALTTFIFIFFISNYYSKITDEISSDFFWVFFGVSLVLMLVPVVTVILHKYKDKSYAFKIRDKKCLAIEMTWTWLYSISLVLVTNILINFSKEGLSKGMSGISFLVFLLIVIFVIGLLMSKGMRGNKKETI